MQVSNEYGLIYSLPTTALDIEVVATKTIRKAGPYYKYAEKYMGVKGAITENSESWELTAVKVYPFGIPNKEEQYLIQCKVGTTPFIFLSKEGLPLSINADPVLDSVNVTKPMARKSSPLDNNQYASVMSEELLMSGSTSRMAEVAAKQIYRIRESRVNLVTGEVDKLPADGESFKLVMTQLDEQEAALTALFMGTTQTETVVKHFTYVPTGDVKNDVIFRLSDFYGIVSKEDVSGAPVYLNVEITQKGELPVDNKGKEKKMPKDGVAYCIPGKAEVSVTYNNKVYCKTQVQVAQFGVIFGLDPSLFTDKKSPSYVIFYPETGAIREIGK
ncbi:MAG: DUF4831 family protein [Barnesiella sp.]